MTGDDTVTPTLPTTTTTDQPMASESMVKSVSEGTTSICSNNTSNANLHCSADLSCNSQHICFTKNCTEAITISLVNSTNSVQNNSQTITLTITINYPAPDESILLEINNSNTTSCTSS